MKCTNFYVAHGFVIINAIIFQLLVYYKVNEQPTRPLGESDIRSSCVFFTSLSPSLLSNQSLVCTEKKKRIQINSTHIRISSNLLITSFVSSSSFPSETDL